MKQELQSKIRKPSLGCSLVPLIVMILLLAIGYGKFGLRTEPILILIAFIAGIIAWKHGMTWAEMQEPIVE